MIEDLMAEMTPYIVEGKKLYDESDVRKALVNVIKKTSLCTRSEPVETPLNQYPEATC